MVAMTTAMHRVPEPYRGARERLEAFSKHNAQFQQPVCSTRYLTCHDLRLGSPSSISPS